MRIGDRLIARAQPVYVIAEIGVNHDGDVRRALELADAAAEAGADAVKLQYFETDRLLSREARLAGYQRAAGETDPSEMLRRLELTVGELEMVASRAHERGMHAIVSVFSVELVELAARVCWDAWKSASPDIVNRPLLEALGGTGRALIVSTGASTAEEVCRAAGWLEACGASFALLHCVSCYPTAPEDASLGAIAHLARLAGGRPVGYSDHTSDEETGAWAAALGACILEKHLTYDRRARGPDHAASLDPAGFAEYVRRVRAGVGSPASGDVRLGDGRKRVLACEEDVRRSARQSLITARGLGRGHVLARADLTIKRPGTGIAPYRLDEVVGRRVARALEGDVSLREEDLVFEKVREGGFCGRAVAGEGA